MTGSCGRFISVGVGPAHRGYMNADLWSPTGLPVRTLENAPLVTTDAEDSKGVRIAKTEEIALEAHPEATHFRYPCVYGPYPRVPRE